MARIRSIKPEFWTSAQVLECSTNARLLFIGLWNFCDDCGRHPASPKQVKASVFPADDFSMEQIDGMLQELSKNDLICLYTSGGVEYFYVKGWKHQRIDKPQPAKYPDPFSEHSKNIPVAIPPDRIGEDKKGKEIDIAQPKAVERANGNLIADKKQNLGEKFPEFYLKHPKHKSKAAAERAYRAARKRGHSHEEIMAGLARAIAKDPRFRDPSFTPYPASWLNADGFLDEHDSRQQPRIPM